MIHDDLLPMYLTLKYLCQNDVKKCLKNFVIAFQDNVKVELYEEIFDNVIYLQSKQFNEKQILCFKSVTVGLESESVWYNHGFEGVNGPVWNLNFRPFLIEEFRRFVLDRLKIGKYLMIF